MHDERLEALRTWLRTLPGVRADSLRPASTDASFRRYFRVDVDDGTAIAMDAPPPQEDVRPFLRVAGMLEEIGLNAPRVLAADAEAGRLLLTDLGAADYLASLDTGPFDALYRDAVDALVVLQQGGERFRDELPPYDEALLRVEMSLFRDWLCEKHLNLEFDASAETAWAETMQYLIDSALEQPRVFVHRDYHSRNLMQSERDNPGILDFQDAMNGPLTYDLVSLLKDCYFTMSETTRSNLVTYYLAQLENDIEAETFRRWFDLMGVQRHLKASGIFCRLLLRDGKAGYLKDVPRTLDYIVALRDAYNELAWLCDWISERVQPELQA